MLTAAGAAEHCQHEQDAICEHNYLAVLHFIAINTYRYVLCSLLVSPVAEQLVGYWCLATAALAESLSRVSGCNAQ